MKDVLANLAKLPPFCFAVIDNRPVVVRRGAREPTPIAGMSRGDVAVRNHNLGVTEAQEKAMIVGVTLGWDMDGADPDHQDPQEPLGDELFEYRYQAEIVGEIVIQARSEELAAREAKMRLGEVCDWLEGNDPIPGQVVGYAPSETLDLVDTTDPRP